MKISVITTVRNAEQTLNTCLWSVAWQERISPSGKPFEVEHVVIDGASTDGTVDLARRYPNTVRCLVSEQDRGIYDGMNKGLSRATGDIVGFLNADDFYIRSDTLGRIVDALGAGVDACYGNVIYVDREDICRIRRIWHTGGYRRKRFRSGWMPPHPTFFARRAAYEKWGLMRLDLGTAADYELMLRFLYRERLSATRIPGFGVAMRAGGASNASLRDRLRANSHDRRAWQLNGLRPAPGFRLLKPLRKIPQFLSSGNLSIQNDLKAFVKAHSGQGMPDA